MNIPTIQTGIYRHFKKGNLYFLERLGLNANSNEEEYWVCYWALYPGRGLPLFRSLEGFNAIVHDGNGKEVKRFELVLPYPTENMEMLLPGTPVYIPHFDSKPSDRTKPEFEVEKVFEEDGKVLVKLKTLNSETNFGPQSLEVFLGWLFLRPAII